MTSDYQPSTILVREKVSENISSIEKSGGIKNMSKFYKLFHHWEYSPNLGEFQYSLYQMPRGGS